MTTEAKKQILHTFSLVEKIRKILESGVNNFDESTISEFMDLLEQYQAAVIQVGTSIEHCVNEEDRNDVITLLEGYCEDIFHLSECIGDASSYRSAMIGLREVHRNITAKLEALPTKKMALFLPYKYSMWDSLESIYIAANNDPDFDAVLMPIPYKECEEGKEDRWIYEGPDYYKGYNALSFKEFNYAEQYPDVVYIHNPYDNLNKVTSVAPEYYSANLKAYCKKIVYIPYFFTNSEFPGMHRNLPTYDNFDYIVVPSTKAKDQIAEYIGEGKVLDLGSPKVDSMLSLKENYELPVEWENRIRGRKVVMYNVSLNSILQNGFQTILKMNYVFDYFKNHQDVVLWWRPHPLLKSTLKTMKPELLGAFEAMERKYILEKIGIYDLDSDSNRAVAATDAFLGDYSSMCGLYGMMGKPCLLTDTISMQEPSDEDKRKFNIIYPACIEVGRVEKDGGIFCYLPDYSALCLLNTDDYSLKVVKTFEQKYYKVQAFDVTNEAETRLYFFPEDRDFETLVYKVSDDSVSYIDDFKGIPTQKYGMIFDLGDEWFITPKEETKALFINKASKNTYETDNHNAKLHPYCELTGDALLSGCAFKLEDKVYVLAYQTAKLLIIDLTNKTSRLVDIADGSGRYSSMAYIKEKLYLASWDGSYIGIYDIKSNKLIKISEFPDGFMAMSSVMHQRYTPSLMGFVLKGDDLLILPFLANMILKLDINSNELSQYVMDVPYEEGQRKASYFSDRSNYLSLLLCDDEHILIQTAFDKSFIKLNLINDEVENIHILVPENLYQENKLTVLEQASRDRNQSPYFIREKGLSCTLNDMIEFVKNMDGWDSQKQHDASSEGVINADGTCGQAVHEYIKKQV